MCYYYFKKFRIIEKSYREKMNLGNTKDSGDAGETDVTKIEGKQKILSRYDFGKRWHRFRVLTPRSCILRGSYAMNDLRFKYKSRGRQAAPCSIVAIVYGRLLKPKEWTKEYVDQVLEYGDKLFRISIIRNPIKQDEYMKTSLVHKEFYIGFYKILIHVEDSGIHGNLFNESVGCSNFASGLQQFLQSNNSGVITAQGKSVAVWRQPDIGFLYYDPASCNEIGLHYPNGTGCLIGFKHISNICDHLLKNMDQYYDSRYCIDKITVIRVTEIGRSVIDRPSNVADLVVHKSVLRSINPIDIEEHKMDCTKPVLKERKLPIQLTGKIHREPLSISISNYSIDRDFAIEPLINRNNFDTGYSYDNIRVNVPSMFNELHGKMAILHGVTNEGSEMYKGKGNQNVANCVMSIAMKKIHPVKTWTRKKLDEILTLGDMLYADVKSEKPQIQIMTAADLNDTRIKIDNHDAVIDVDLITVAGTINSKIPSVLNLKQALEEFFLVNKDGVIETASMAVAIWTENDCYYLFDPRACDAAGIRIKEEKAVKHVGKGKETEVVQQKQEKGTCCVIRFPNIDSLLTLFLKNIDPSKKNDRFTIRHVTVVDDIPGTRSWNEFQPGMAGKTWVLRGEISNMDGTFDEENQGVQGLAMPVVALISASETPPSKWSKETVDEVVMEGDTYYNWCKPPKTEEETEMIFLPQDLKKHLYFKNRKVNIDIEEATVVGDLSASDDAELLNLEKGLQQFFEKKQYGIVEVGDLAVAIWKTEEDVKDKDKNIKKEIVYYYFDPNPRDELGQLVTEALEENAACVVRTLNLSILADLIKKNVGDTTERGNDFAIHELKNISIGTPMTNEEIEADKQILIKPDLNNYTNLGDNGAVLLGSINQGNEILFKQQTRGKQQSANSLTALAMTKLYNPHLWYRELVDDILKVGDKLSSENLMNIPEEEEGQLPRKYLIPSDITEDFAIGVNRFSIGLEEESVIGKVTDLTVLLERFFERSTMGIFRQGDTIMPIWKEGNVFFIMDPKGRNVQGEPREQDGTAAVMWFTNLASLANTIQAATKGEDFVIDGVTIENSYETRVAEADRVKKTISGEDLWHHFPKIIDGVWAIDGNVTMMDEKFNEDNRNKQSAAIAAMAIIFSKVCHNGF